MNRYPKLRYKGFEVKWANDKINNISKYLKSGGTPKSTNKEYYSGDINFLSISDIKGKYLMSTEKMVSNEAITNSSAWIVPSNTLIYTMYASPAIPFINKFEVAIPQSVIAIKNDDSIIEREFLYYQLLNNKTKIMNLTMTGTQANLSGEVVKKIKISFPSRSEQDRIVSLLTKVDILINEKEKEINNILLIRNYQLKSNFITCLGESKMQDIMQLKNGRDYKHCLPGNIPVYGTGGLMTKIDQYLCNKVAIGIGRKGTIDNPFILEAPFWTVDTLFYAIPKDIPLYYLFLQFQSINWKLYNEGSTLPSLTSKSINNVKIHIHTESEISHISNLFESIDQLLLSSNYELENYIKIKKTLLSKMLV